MVHTSQVDKPDAGDTVHQSKLNPQGGFSGSCVIVNRSQVEPQANALFRYTRLMRARIRHSDSVEHLTEVMDDIHLKHNAFLVGDSKVLDSGPDNAREVLAELGVLQQILVQIRKLTRTDKLEPRPE